MQAIYKGKDSAITLQQPQIKGQNEVNRRIYLKKDFTIQNRNKKCADDSNVTCGISVIELLERAKLAASPMKKQRNMASIKEDSNCTSIDALYEY